MKRLFKRTLAVLLTVIILVGVAPLGIIDLKPEASARSEYSDTYWAMNSDEAKGFIAFIYDTGKITDDMMNAGNLYTFLTGGFERGSVEELCAKISFLVTSKSNISQCIQNYSVVMNNAYESLLEYLMQQAGSDIDDGFANSMLDSVKDSIKSILCTLTGADEGVMINGHIVNILDELEYMSSAYSAISSIYKKVETMKAFLNGFNYIWSTASSAPYKYVSAYISTLEASEGLPDDAADLLYSYNKFALMDSYAFSGAILFYGNDNLIEQVESYGRFIYYVTKSLEDEYISVDNNGNVKIVQVQSPTNVYVYNSNNEIVLSIENNKINRSSNDIFAAAYDSKKCIALCTKNNYTINIIATDDGNMNYKVTEIRDNTILRDVEYNDIVLQKDDLYEGNIPTEIMISNEEYNLICNGNQIISCDYDSLDDTVFKGFPRGLIEDITEFIYYKNSSIDIKKYGVNKSEAKDLMSAVVAFYLIQYNVDLTNAFEYNVTYNRYSDSIVELKINYVATEKNLEPFKYIDAETDIINFIVEKTENLTDFEKALFVHDWLVLNGEYDFQLDDLIDAGLTPEQREQRYEKFGLLVNGKGVCGTYGEAYEYLMNAIGVECIYLSSNSMNHGWNLIKIEGQWYHVDCTWDDPVKDRIGLTRYNYFLLTDIEITEKGYSSWYPNSYKATSKKFSSIPRNDSNKVAYGDGVWCYTKNGALYVSDLYGNNEVLISEESFSAFDVYDGYVYAIKDKIVLKINISDPNEFGPIYSFSEKPYSIYIDESGILTYYTMHEKKPEFINVNDYDYINSIQVKNANISVKNGEPIQLEATAYNDSGALILDANQFNWSSDDIAVASVDATGLVIPDLPGTTVITVSIGDVKAKCIVSVNYWEHDISGICGENAKWNLDVKTKSLNIIGNGSMYDYDSDNQIPWMKYFSHIESVTIGTGIEKIGKRAFSKLTKLESFVVPSNVKEISEYALYGCTSLKEITLPFIGSSINANNTYDAVFGYIFGRLTSNQTDGTVQYYEFSGEQFKGYSYAIPQSLKKVIITDADIIPFGAFYNCNKTTEIILNEGITNIYGYAFSEMDSLVEMTIPKTVIAIEENVFYGCDCIASLTLPFVGSSRAASGTYDAVFGYVFGRTENGTVQYHRSENGTLYYYNYAIPKSLKEVIITDADIIPFGAFHNCSNITKFNINDISHISGYAFANCSGINEFSVPNSVTVIDEYAFNGCNNISSISVPFLGSSRIANGTYDAVLGYIFGRASSGVVQYGIVSDSSLSGYCYAIPSNLKSVIVTDASIVPIGAFSNCTNITYIKVNEGVSELSGYSLMECTGLKEIRLPSTLSMLSYDILYDCSSLEKVYFYSRNCNIDNYNETIPSGATIYAYSNSTAQNYASLLQRNFIPIDVSISTSSLKIDYNKKIIYGVSLNLEDIMSVIMVSGEGTAEISPNKKAVTGTKIELKDVSGIITDCYYVVIFGDVNGDGWYDGMDAVTVSCIANGMLTEEQIGKAKYMAADCNHDGVVDATDVAILEQAGILLADIDQTKTQTELATDSTYVEYCELIDQQPTTNDEQPQEQDLISMIISIIEQIFKYIFAIISKVL